MAGNYKGAQASSASFLPGVFTLATLPQPSLYPRKYAWVSDLFGGPGDNCISDGTYWKPVRPLQTQFPASATMTLRAMVNAPTQIITGTIGTGVTHNITIDTTYAYPGAKFRLTRLANGLGAMIIGGLTGLTINAWADWEYNGTIWVQTASGGLL